MMTERQIQRLQRLFEIATTRPRELAPSGASVGSIPVFNTPDDVEERIRQVDLTMQSVNVDVTAAAAAHTYPDDKAAQWKGTMAAWTLFRDETLGSYWSRFGMQRAQSEIAMANEYEQRAEAVRGELVALKAKVTSPPIVEQPVTQGPVDSTASSIGSLLETGGKILLAGVGALLAINVVQSLRGKNA